MSKGAEAQCGAQAEDASFAKGIPPAPPRKANKTLGFWLFFFRQKASKQLISGIFRVKTWRELGENILNLTPKTDLIRTQRPNPCLRASADDSFEL